MNTALAYIVTFGLLIYMAVELGWGGGKTFETSAPSKDYARPRGKPQEPFSDPPPDPVPSLDRGPSLQPDQPKQPELVD